MFFSFAHFLVRAAFVEAMKNNLALYCQVFISPVISPILTVLLVIYEMSSTLKHSIVKREEGSNAGESEHGPNSASTIRGPV